MEIRRVQMTGGSSYVITLPKNWVESLHIKKNDPLGVLIQPDGTLMVTKNISGDQIQRVKELMVDQQTEPEYFLRLLIGTYIAGYSAIRITTKDRIPGQIRVKLREFSSMVIGPECVEETDQSILLKDLLNPLEMPFENSLKRMFVIVKGMHHDAIESLLHNDHALAEDVMDRDNDVDRLFWLIARQTNMIMQNIHLSRKMNTSIVRMLPHFQVGRIMERVGDHGVRIAHNAMKIKTDDVGDDLSSLILTASEGAIQVFEKSVEAFFSHDLKKANRMIESIHHLEENYNRINSGILSLPTTVAVPIRNIADSIRRTGEYSADIAENVINYEMMVEEA
ncbi:MAG: phosphate uptake regulator PhoU [Methanospirillum sp.]|uniref:phosphate signaling complex PhoU family protein n=1 Tax=Methanospirillum sp. TaxID=45200 RepID=UPI002372F6E2|nr:phosphate uptake regulator PhoU [Methanospirillum sp.]MDD1728937.1 phosphate uptake regulator PhoU [Methanospirillum sp.]